MSSLTIKGILTKKLEPETISGKEGKIWKKQNFIINTGSQFNSEICFQVFGEERIRILEKFNVNEEVEVFFNLYSKKFKERYFHNIDAWKIERVENTNSENDTNEEKTPF